VFGAFLAAVVLATVPGPHVQVVPRDAQAAARVEVVGGTPAEERSARRAVAGSGASSPVRRIVFSDHGENRQVLVEAVGHGSEPDWISRLVASDIVGSAHKRGETIDWVEIRGDGFGDGTSVEPYALRRPSRGELRAFGEAVAARGARHLHRLTEIEAFQVGGGGLKVVLRLSRRELLRGENTRWLTDLFPGRAYEHLLIVLGPGGIPVGGGGTFGHGSGGFWAYGSLARTSQGTPPLRGPVHLRVHVERRIPRSQTFDLALDCTTPDERQACTSFRGDWVRLLPPVVEGVECGGPAGLDEVEIQGTVEGIPVRRAYSGCYGNTVLHWERILGVPANRR
jgi:hypothetical protein